MSCRVRWYLADLLKKAELQRIAEGMRKDAYSEQTGWGFTLDLLRPSYIEARFYERFKTIEKIVDPFGHAQEILRVSYQTTPFRLSVQAPQMEFYDPPRSLAPILNQLANYLDFRIAFSPADVDPEIWFNGISRQTGAATVTGIVMSRVSLTNSVYAKIALIGSEDVRRFVKRFAESAPLKFEKLQFSHRMRNQDCVCELSADGRAAILVGDSERLLPVLRDGLKSALDLQ